MTTSVLVDKTTINDKSTFSGTEPGAAFIKLTGQCPSVTLSNLEISDVQSTGALAMAQFGLNTGDSSFSYTTVAVANWTVN